LPVVASVPHGSGHIPEELLTDLVRPERLWADAFTPELYQFLALAGAATVQAKYSQFVANPNRRPGSPKFAPFWEGIVPSTNSDGEALYSLEPTTQQIDERIRLAYDAYHADLDAAVADRLSRFDRILLLDLHSFGMDLDANIIVGDGNGTTSRPDVVGRIEDALQDQGYNVWRNLRFSGGWIVRRYSDNPRVDAIQVELNQRCYADPSAVDARVLPLPYDAARVRRTALQLEQGLSDFLCKGA
jgi:N-formylglutamate deformylase